MTINIEMDEASAEIALLILTKVLEDMEKVIGRESWGGEAEHQRLARIYVHMPLDAAVGALEDATGTRQ